MAKLLFALLFGIVLAFSKNLLPKKTVVTPISSKAHFESNEVGIRLLHKSMTQFSLFLFFGVTALLVYFSWGVSKPHSSDGLNWVVPVNAILVAVISGFLSLGFTIGTVARYEEQKLLGKSPEFVSGYYWFDEQIVTQDKKNADLKDKDFKKIAQLMSSGLTGGCLILIVFLLLKPMRLTPKELTYWTNFGFKKNTISLTDIRDIQLIHNEIKHLKSIEINLHTGQKLELKNDGFYLLRDIRFALKNSKTILPIVDLFP
jgi:hypothetical protein